MVSRFVSVATGPGVSGDYFMGRGEAYSHKRDAGASGDRPDGEMGVRKAEKAEMDNGQFADFGGWQNRTWVLGRHIGRPLRGKSVWRMEFGISPSVSCADSSLIRGSRGVWNSEEYESQAGDVCSGIFGGSLWGEGGA